MLTDPITRALLLGWGGLVGVMAFFVLSLNPIWAVMFTVATYPLNTLAQFSGTSLIQLSGVATVIAWLGSLVRGRKQIVWVNQFVWLIVLSGIALSLSLVAVDLNTHLHLLGVFVRNALFYFLIVNIVSSKADVEKIIWVAVIAFGLLGLLTTYQAFVNPYFLASAKTFTLYGVRAAGTFADQGQYGREVVGFIALGLYLALTSRSRLHQILATLATSAIALGILASQTRSAWVGLAVIFVLILPRLLHSRGRIGFFIVLLLLFLAWQLKGGMFMTRLATISLNSSDVSVRARIGAIFSGLNMLRDHWLVGVGMGNFALYVSQYASNTMQVLPNMDAHNWVIEVLSELGIPGFLAFSAVIIMSARDAWRARRESPAGYYIFVAIVAVTITGLTETLITVKAFWLFAGLATALARTVQYKAAEAEQPLTAMIKPVTVP